MSEHYVTCPECAADVEISHRDVYLELESEMVASICKQLADAHYRIYERLDELERRIAALGVDAQGAVLSEITHQVDDTLEMLRAKVVSL